MKVHGLTRRKSCPRITRINTEGSVVSNPFFLSVIIRVIRGPVLGDNTWRIF